jgi:hypothetical protein
MLRNGLLGCDRVSEIHGRNKGWQTNQEYEQLGRAERFVSANAFNHAFFVRGQ